MSEAPGEYLAGVISDTHGRFPPQVETVFANIDLIIHAGDFDTNQVLAQFRQLANLIAVRGNMDQQSDLVGLSKSEVAQVGEVFSYVIHDLMEMDLDPRAAGFQVVIHGHLHRSALVNRQGILYLNPGSPTRPRRSLKPGAAMLRIRADQVACELIPFD